MGLLDKFDNYIGGLSPEANMGLLTGGLGLLGGESLPNAVNLGMGFAKNLKSFGDDKKQRSAIKELEEKYKDNPKMLALLKANPTGFIQALTTSTLTPKKPVSNYVDLTDQQKIELGIKPYLIAQRDASTNQLRVINPYENTDLSTLTALNTTNSQNEAPTDPTGTNQQATPIAVDADKGTVTVRDTTTETGLRIVPIEGGEAELEIRKADEATRKINKAGKLYYKNLNKRVGVLNREIDKALTLLEPHDDWRGGWGIGTGAGFESLLSFIPTTEAKELKAVLDTISGIVGFERLGEMKAESLGGGALGAINSKELELLTGSQGSLKQDLKPSTLRSNLLKLQADYAETQLLADEAYEDQFGVAPPDRLITDEEEADLTNFTPTFREMMGQGLTDDQLKQVWSVMPNEQRKLFK